MPELPEVETIKNQLNRLIVGKKITDVSVSLPKLIKTSHSSFKKNIRGTRIEKICRRAKIFIFKLKNEFSLVVHLKMTGQLIFAQNEKELEKKRNKYTHLIFKFSDSSFLLFNDLRQFGYLKLVPQKMVSEVINEPALGPEPLERVFTIKKFEEILKTRPERKIKQFLMDPYLIAGIGNIYSDEILFLSHVRPTRRVKTLSKKEKELIFKNIKKVLKEAIRDRGTSASDYVDAQGKEGGYDKKLRVYGKKKGKCPKCGGDIKHIKIAGRTAHFCPSCQK